MLMRRAEAPEVGAVYRFPSKRFFIVLCLRDGEVWLEQVDVNAMKLVPDSAMCMTLGAMAKGVLAWHAKDWRRKVADCKEIQA